MTKNRKKPFLGKRPEIKITVLALGLLFVALFIQGVIEKESISNCPRYVIGYTMEVTIGQMKYRYRLNGKGYSNYWNIKSRSLSEGLRGGLYYKSLTGQRFLVLVSCTEPKISKVDWTHSIPDSVEFAPEEGWKTIPKEFPKTEFAD
jgi:hypothetical protein